MLFISKYIIWFENETYLRVPIIVTVRVFLFHLLRKKEQNKYFVSCKI